MTGGSMVTFEILPGLPADGPDPIQFSTTGQGAHSEGLAVAFGQGPAERWIGNFQRGPTGYDCLIGHPNGRDVIVVAGGDAYVVDPGARRLVETVGGSITFCAGLPEMGAVLFADGLSVTICHRNGLRESSGRISWDGMRALEIDGTVLRGEAADPMTGGWIPFELDLLEMSHKGGSYPSEPA